MLELKGVDTSYGAVPMLRGVAMSVRPGELVCLLGPNGAGKTTTFMTVCGVVRAQRGKVEVMGRDMATLGTENLASLGVGLVPEGRRLFPSLTVIENLRLGYDAVSGRGPDFEAQLDKMGNLFPRIQERLRQVAGTLSGGEQAMVALARALIGEPRLVIMDEPSLGLSPKLIGEYFEITREIHRRGTTILLIEQNAEMGLGIADRGYVLVKGKVAQEGPAKELLSSKAARSLYL
ncbi:MAG: ATP-binding cassette domain-containing protein [Mesorhizobium sp.]|uniref:ABC transporter ATP-binding protein n=1 Tax=unclassified Mesorhizobium TaxID=325217 RepID=UPI000F75928F|nr:MULTISPECIES: ABC transporter ATP-binding protein [unclassified Mesorhizobium]RUU32954.1 ATP-binding cassette domain-containing protein [Mesorhizobium sp. M6A.T.Ca.TU.002.02.2.1]AZO63762.1 ABC transporter ATP-binding protein [Mesorhizobium sp. M6A.T.Cr.TU.016.01.1.1]RWP53433.1 MAG: ATP-binding cassette domain-containing protein [Mesorhizobium sp.]RWQ41195.1 MAG: ATP-binding cassette domain-containing protein [Mesorhizobium sp.]RWQ44073.1 MAG: ATP-binding cassette domain-containing protein [